MGLLSSIVKTALTPAAAIGKAILSVVKPSSSIAQQPVSKTTSQLASTTFGKVLGGATALTAGALAVSSGAINKVLPTAKSKVIAAVAAPAAISLIAENPNAPIAAASNLGQFGADIGKFSADPSLKSAAEIAKGSPLITAGLGVLGVAAVGKAAGGVIGGALQSKAIREQTDVIREQQQIPQLIPSQPYKEEVNPLFEEDILDEKETLSSKEPITPKTEELKKPRRKRAKKRAKEGQGQTIRQSVRVQVGVNAANKKYLNRVVYN